MRRNVSTAARGSGERRLSTKRPGWLRRERDQRAEGLRRDRWPRGARRPPRRRPRCGEPPEDRVGRVLRDALAAGERQRAEVEVARAPAEHGGVEGHDQRRGADRGRAGEEASRPGRPRWTSTSGTTGACRPWRAATSSIGTDAWWESTNGDAARGRRPRHGEVGVAVSERQDADRREQRGRRAAGRRTAGRQVRGRDVAQHARHQPPPVEGGPVGAAVVVSEPALPAR